MVFSGASLPGLDSIKSNRLDFGLHCIPILLSIGENGGPRSGAEVSGEKERLKTSNSSSKSVTSTTSSSSMLAGRYEVVICATCCSDEAPTFGTPSKKGVAASMPSGIGLGSKNPRAAMLIHYNQGSLALMIHLGPWKFLDIGI